MPSLTVKPSLLRTGLSGGGGGVVGMMAARTTGEGNGGGVEICWIDGEICWKNRRTGPFVRGSA